MRAPYFTEKERAVLMALISVRMVEIGEQLKTFDPEAYATVQNIITKLEGTPGND